MAVTHFSDGRTFRTDPFGASVFEVGSPFEVDLGEPVGPLEWELASHKPTYVRPTLLLLAFLVLHE